MIGDPALVVRWMVMPEMHSACMSGPGLRAEDSVILPTIFL